MTDYLKVAIITAITPRIDGDQKLIGAGGRYAAIDALADDIARRLEEIRDATAIPRPVPLPRPIIADGRGGADGMGGV